MNNNPSGDAVIELLTLTCEIDEDGDKIYYNKECKLHRIHGPAIIRADGSEYWYRNGRYHREDGPAIIWDDDNEWFYINDRRLTKESFIQWQKDNGIK